MEYWINVRLLNFLNNIQCPERIVCYISTVGLKCYYEGGNHFIYDLVNKSITVRQSVLLETSFVETEKINKNILEKIVEKLSNREVKKTDDEILKEKYNIKTKRLSEKEKKKIFEYERLIESNRNKSNSKTD